MSVDTSADAVTGSASLRACTPGGTDVEIDEMRRTGCQRRQFSLGRFTLVRCLLVALVLQACASTHVPPATTPDASALSHDATPVSPDVTPDHSILSDQAGADQT